MYEWVALLFEFENCIFDIRSVCTYVYTCVCTYGHRRIWSSISESIYTHTHIHMCAQAHIWVEEDPIFDIRSLCTYDIYMQIDVDRVYVGVCNGDFIFDIRSLCAYVSVQIQLSFWECPIARMCPIAHTCLFKFEDLIFDIRSLCTREICMQIDVHRVCVGVCSQNKCIWMSHVTPVKDIEDLRYQERVHICVRVRVYI